MLDLQLNVIKHYLGVWTSKKDMVCTWKVKAELYGRLQKVVIKVGLWAFSKTKSNRDILKALGKCAD